MGEKMNEKAEIPKKTVPVTGNSGVHLINFVTAGLGGITGWTVVHPLNTLSVRMNLAAALKDPKSKHFLGFTRDLIKREGIRSLYAGLTAGWTRQIFYSTSVFGFFEVIRDQIGKYREIDLFSRSLAGICSGGFRFTIYFPSFVVNTLLLFLQE
jgi:hypothetical protein